MFYVLYISAVYNLFYFGQCLLNLTHDVPYHLLYILFSIF